MSIPRGRVIAFRTASCVTSWKTILCTGLSPMASRARSQVRICQAIASPSRSGSVAKIRLSAFSSATAIA